MKFATPDGYTVEIINLDGVGTYSVRKDGYAVGGGAGFKTRGLVHDVGHVAALLGDSFADLQEETS
jgi:hypothetical protein